ncbi:MAG TPA: zinc-ribbon domain-containing protein, partial [Crinalium sp.]
MIVCPNCNHQNPDGAVQCEACYTPLPATMSCPNCGTTVQADASFCGQCGNDLRTAASEQSAAIASPSLSLDASSPAMPSLLPLDPLVPPDPLVATPLPFPNSSPPAMTEPVQAAPVELPPPISVSATNEPSSYEVASPVPAASTAGSVSTTQLQ